jgi:hypothetical protein
MPVAWKGAVVSRPVSQGAVTLATLVIAIFGLVLSAISLTWQAATFVMSGSRVRASLRHGARGGASVVSGPPASQSFRALAEQGFTYEVIGIEVRNVGRLAVQVTGVRAALPSGVQVQETRSSMGPGFPYRLEAQSSQTWFLPGEMARSAVAASAAIGKGSDPADVWMEVELGNGKVVRTKQRVSLGSAGSQ